MRQRDNELSTALQETLEGFVEEGREPGGAVCVVRDGTVVAEAWAGTCDGTRPWTPDTLVMGYSVAKPLAALTVLSVVAEGRIGLDQPVVDIWPEYGEAGKGSATVRHLLSHQAGQPSFPLAAADISFTAHDALVGLLARTPAEHPPGTTVAEHALTYGHLCDALVRHAAGETLAERFSRLAHRHGWDAHLCLSDQDLPRVADVVPLADTWPGSLAGDATRGPALARPSGLLEPSVLNSTAWRTTSFPAVSVHASARGIAAFYADVLDPDGSVTAELGPALRQEYLSEQASGHDLVLDREVTWSLGFLLDPGEFGMGGSGGCAGWASEAAGYAAAYMTRGLGGHDRADLLYDVIEATPHR
jgi:CubicO group peptidase (beta-lactamase class C family)